MNQNEMNNGVPQEQDLLSAIPRQATREQQDAAIDAALFGTDRTVQRREPLVAKSAPAVVGKPARPAVKRSGVFANMAIPGQDQSAQPEQAEGVEYTLYLSRSRRRMTRGCAMPPGQGILTIGRAEGSTLWLKSAAVSGRHAQITQERGVFQVTDLGSTNHVYLNRQIIPSDEPTTLEHGDALGFADQDYFVWIIKSEGGRA